VRDGGKLEFSERLTSQWQLNKRGVSPDLEIFDFINSKLFLKIFRENSPMTIIWIGLKTEKTYIGKTSF